jgi:hypothetical protein
MSETYFHVCHMSIKECPIAAAGQKRPPRAEESKLFHRRDAEDAEKIEGLVQRGGGPYMLLLGVLVAHESDRI